MSNRIKTTSISCPRLNPAEAEIWITVYAEQVTSTTRVEGRLVGPRCRYASTVEVAYPMREHSRRYEKEGEPSLTMRAIIPEPSLWDPQAPLLYEGHLDLFHSGALADRVQITHGLRTLKLSPQGLRWNGKPLSLHAITRRPSSKEEALPLRVAGYNALVTPVQPDMITLWESSDRLGFLVLSVIEDRDGFRHTLTSRRHTCDLGWIMNAQVLNDPLVQAVVDSPSLTDRLVGVELNGGLNQAMPQGIQFVVCEQSVLPKINDVNLPRLLRRNQALTQSKQAETATVSETILGYIDS